jgi:hypothetical protein
LPGGAASHDPSVAFRANTEVAHRIVLGRFRALEKSCDRCLPQSLLIQVPTPGTRSSPRRSTISLTLAPSRLMEELPRSARSPSDRSWVICLDRTVSPAHDLARVNDFILLRPRISTMDARFPGSCQRSS